MDIGTMTGIGRAPSEASYSASQSQRIANESALFKQMLDAKQKTLESGRYNGEYTEGFANSFSASADKTASALGDARGSLQVKTGGRTIDKTSKLYEKSLELESFFVKIMLQSMRQTVSKTNLAGSENQFASKMYDDMLYDQYTEALTKNAGFGLADQIYLELS